VPSPGSVKASHPGNCYTKKGKNLQKFSGGSDGIIESENHLGWKRTLRSSSPTTNPTLPSPPLNHVPKCHSYMSFKYLQGW